MNAASKARLKSIVGSITLEQDVKLHGLVRGLSGKNLLFIIEGSATDSRKNAVRKAIRHSLKAAYGKMQMPMVGVQVQSSNERHAMKQYLRAADWVLRAHKDGQTDKKALDEARFWEARIND